MRSMATGGFGAKKIAAALGVTHVYHRTWAGSREMFETIGNAWLRRLKAWVAAKRRFLRVAQKHHTAQRHSAKTRHLTRHLTPWHSPQTPRAPQRQTTRGKTLLFCDTIPNQKFRASLNLKMGPGGPKNRGKRAPRLIFFVFDDRPADGRKHQCKNEESSKFRNKYAFLPMCTFPRSKKQILVKQDVSNNMHFGLDPLRDLNGFSNSHNFGAFQTPKKEGSNQERSSKSGSRVEMSSPRTSQRGPFWAEEGGPKVGAIPSFERRKKGAEGELDHPVSLLGNRAHISCHLEQSGPVSVLERKMVALWLGSTTPPSWSWASFSRARCLFVLLVGLS